MKFFVLVIPFLFFFISLLTVKDYGVSWDEPIHFHRGQAYLNYFLTGKMHFDLEGERVSYYQNNSLPAEYFIENDSGHPPLNGILASLSNFIFYQKLGILGDIESYHLFNIAVSTLAVFVVTIFAYQTYGIVAALVAGILISTYPLFFSEGHFNIKDPAQTAFFALTIWAFWMSLKKGSWRWLILSVIGFSLALGTKFNILFLPFIILPYLFVRYYSVIGRGASSILHALLCTPHSYLILLILSPFIISVIFIGTWPYLWQDPISNFLSVIGYYKDLGTGTTVGYFVNGFNLYPLIWILTTTPPWVIVLATVGLFFSLRYGFRGDKVAILWLLWFLVPIIRVSLPNTVIYGGVRQIMEFIPAMALLSGLGAWQIANLIQKLNIKYQNYISKIKIANHILLNFKLYFCILTFAFLIYPIIKLHPNQNVYFNSFIGGLSGAKEKNIPYWGNSFGNAYWQAIQWLNENADKNARVALIQGTGLNIPRFKFRSDIAYSNSYWSGINRGGEYLVELTHDDPVKVYPYAWEYIERFLEPVHEVKVEGVAIAKVWKNDFEHTRAEFQLKEMRASSSYRTEDNRISVDLGERGKITRLTISWSGFPGCDAPAGRFYTSIDARNWQEEPERWPLSYSQIPAKAPIPLNYFTFFLPGREARFVEFVADNFNSCHFQNPKVELFVLK